MNLFDLSFFLNSANFICRGTDILKYLGESLGLRDNESRLYCWKRCKTPNHHHLSVHTTHSCSLIMAVVTTDGNIRHCSICQWTEKAWTRSYKTFLCSAQLSMKFVLLINLKLPTTANSFLLNIAEHENFSPNKYENANYCWHFHIYY